jgi:hypothetical protein
LDNRRFEPEDCVQKRTLCTSLRPNEPKKNFSAVSEFEEEKEKLNNEKWLAERKALRQGLNNMDLNSEYLNNKKDLTESEYRVLRTLENSKEKQRIIKHLGNAVFADKIIAENESLDDRVSNYSKSVSNLSEDLPEQRNKVQLPPIIRSEEKLSRFVKKQVEGDGNEPANEEQVENIYEKIIKLKNKGTEFYKKAAQLNVADTKVLRRALVYPIEVKSELLVNDMIERAESEKKERIMARLAHKRRMRDKYIGYGRSDY